MTDPAHYLVGLEGATLRIKGTVNGKVLVYSAQHIVIEDDLRYADARGATTPTITSASSPSPTSRSRSPRSPAPAISRSKRRSTRAAASRCAISAAGRAARS